MLDKKTIQRQIKNLEFLATQKYKQHVEYKGFSMRYETAYNELKSEIDNLEKRLNEMK